jgi:hypothetical protein
MRQVKYRAHPVVDLHMILRSTTLPGESELPRSLKRSRGKRLEVVSESLQSDFEIFHIVLYGFYSFRVLQEL